MTGGERHAYIGSFTSQGGHGITTAAVDPATGALRVLGHTAEPDDPSWLAIGPGGSTLYAVSERPDGALAALSLADPDRPEPAGPPVPVGGAAPTHLALSRHRAFTANYTSGSVSALPLAEGLPRAAGLAVRRHHGAGPRTDRQGGPHAHAAVLAPGGRRLLVTDLGTDSVWSYGLDPADDTPRLSSTVRLRPGSGPRHLAFHPAGHTVYVVHELESIVTRCRWDDATGRLEPAGETRVLPPDAAAANHPSGLVISPDGTRGYVANRGHDSIAVLALDTPDGLPELLGTVGCQGHWPRALTLDARGRRLYVANERSGGVAWFHLEPGEGMPKAAGAVEAPAASCVVLR